MPPTERLGWLKIFAAFFRIGLTSFGGGLVAYVREEVVTAKEWMTDEEFLAALEIGQTLPGLNAVNVSIICGRRLGGPLGSVAAALGIIIPGAAILVGLGYLYIHFEKNPEVKALLAGVAAAAVGLLLQVTLKIGAKQFLKPVDLLFVIITFVLTGILHISLIIVLFVVAPFAIMYYRPRAHKKA
ncbi:chromate transporter [Ruficoccus sp. ZRK36]|uniref:chromate transporter n=1 Tax=Ruficoccus sp. ZRK36 TaxID=2866311 RepID=UPI001C732F07|nr:chromate transporter [Ruficoccus sp. ZRK36]QYY34693.1 chromate transporter [Ruficoccus sp. ZRK36]